MEIEGLTPALKARLAAGGRAIRKNGNTLRITVQDRREIPQLARLVVEHGAALYRLSAAFLALYTLGVRAASHHLHIMAGHDPLLEAILPTQLLVMGLFFGYFIIALMTIFAGTGTISSEIESGVLQAIVTRPLSRTTVVGGKFLGLGGLLVLYALGFFCLIPLVLLAVTILGSTVLPTLANGVAVFALYTLGFIGGTVEQIGALIDNSVMLRIGIISSLIMPADALYRTMVAVLTAATTDPLAAVRQMGPLGSLSAPSVWMLVYTLAYTGAALSLAVHFFLRRDLGAGSYRTREGRCKTGAGRIVNSRLTGDGGVGKTLPEVKVC